MSLGPTVLLVYGAVMLFGGVMGYRAGSRASLIAGTASGVLLLGSWLLTRSSPEAGLWCGAAISLLLCGVTGMRLAKTRKFMPSGLLLGLSVISLILLVYSVTSGAGN